MIAQVAQSDLRPNNLSGFFDIQCQSYHPKSRCAGIQTAYPQAPFFGFYKKIFVPYYFIRMSFLTDFTPFTSLATLAALLISPWEFTKPLS